MYETFWTDSKIK